MSYRIENNRVILDEPLTDVEKIFELASKLKDLDSNKIIIDMANNYSLPSTIIGQLTFLKHQGKDVEIWVYDKLLYELFEDLGLNDMFEVKMKKK